MQDADVCKSHHPAVPGELHLFSSGQGLKTQLHNMTADLRKNDLILKKIDLSHRKNFNSGKICNGSETIPETKNSNQISGLSKI